MLAKDFKSPFDVDLRCNVSIEVNVAMRLGELILTSGVEDKQLIALGYKLSSSMKYLLDNLDDKQWDKVSDYVEEQSVDEEDGYYSSQANRTMGQIADNGGKRFAKPCDSSPRTDRTPEPSPRAMTAGELSVSIQEQRERLGRF